MTTYKYKKLNNEPIEIEYVEDEHDEEMDFKPSFWWNNKRYYLENFLRAHNNPWGGLPNAPEYIHGYEAEEYWHPLFIELVGGDEAVNVYEEYSEEEEGNA